MVDDETRKENQRLYEQYVKEANNNLKSNHESQDKMTLTMSVALFGLMPFLLKELQADLCIKILVFFLIMFNVFSLITVLLSFWLCAKGIEKDMKYIEEYYLEFKDESFFKQSCYTKSGKLCNTLSLIFIAITLTILAITLGVYFFSKG